MKSRTFKCQNDKYKFETFYISLTEILCIKDRKQYKEINILFLKNQMCTGKKKRTDVKNIFMFVEIQCKVNKSLTNYTVVDF